MSALGRFLDRLYLAGAWLAGALLVLLCLLVLWSILARLVGAYAGGATDLAGYVMATSTFLGLAHAFRNAGHIRVVVAIQGLAGPARRGVEIACLAVMAAISGFLAWHMTILAIESRAFGDRSEGADAILLWIPQAPVALGSMLFALAVLHSLAEALAGAAPPVGEGPPEA